jgi:hypothetical protein
MFSSHLVSSRFVFLQEVRRSGGGRKRVRRSSDWWKHAQADAEKLKRSAAVECLMSASEQVGFSLVFFFPWEMKFNLVISKCHNKYLF